MILEDGTGDSYLAQVDSQSRVMTAALTISIPHTKIHLGESYTAEVVAAGGSGTKVTLTFTTPDSHSALMHMVIHVRSNVEANYKLGENPTITGGTGTDFTVYNRNRNSTNTSQVLGTRSAVAGQMTDGATVTDFGTVLEDLHFGNGKLGGEDRGADEWVLKRNTTYVLELESEAANSDNMVEIDWYEGNLILE